MRHLLLAPLLVLFACAATAQPDPDRIKAKAARAKAAVERWVDQGRDPGPAVVLLKQVAVAGKAGDLVRAEALLDRALALLAVPASKYTPPEPPTDAFADARPVRLTGYDGQLMEPFLSRDGKTLYFNNRNDPKVDTDLHSATRVDALTFRYVGPLTAANSRQLDAVASVDRLGRFLFVTTRSYGRDGRTLYAGMLKDGRFVGPVPLAGDIAPGKPGWLNMDAELSADGETLYFTVNDFSGGVHLPRSSELRVARRKGQAFMTDPRSAALMRSVNSKELEYAPCTSADELELYITRAGKLIGGHSSGAKLRILMATRTRKGEPFGAPKWIRAITGFVEAPTISPDGKHLYFHKRAGGKLALWCVRRK